MSKKHLGGNVIDYINDRAKADPKFAEALEKAQKEIKENKENGIPSYTVEEVK